MFKNKKSMKQLLIALFVFAAFATQAQKFEELGKTPAMGWNSWNTFACNIDEELIKQTADLMVSTGMRDAGYIYLNLDDCWHGERDSLGFIHCDPRRFPSGMEALSEYVHSKGLKLGIYSDAGWKTCGGKPGSRGYEFQDAITYASWGIDYLKYDWCNTDNLNAEEAYKTMSTALKSAGHPIYFSICEWGTYKPWTWGAKYAQSWRTTGDIFPCWNGELGHGAWVSNGIMQILDMQKDLRQYAGPGHWNDPDMMEVGNGMSVNEDRAHFSLWCMLAAPLIAGNDLTKMSKQTLEILTNKEAIAINQDELGVQCFKWFKIGDLEIYAKPLANDELAVCFLNRGETIIKHAFNWQETENIYDGVSGKNYEFNKVDYKIRDVWAKKALGTTNEVLNVEVPAHDVLMLRLTK
jgi:alpha-galactosidase